MKDYQKLETICQNTHGKQTSSIKKYGFKTVAATLATIYALSATPVQAGDLSIRPTEDRKGGMLVYSCKFGPGSETKEKGLTEKINEAYAGKGLSTGAKVLITTLIIGGIAYGIYAIVDNNRDKGSDDTPAPTPPPEEPPPGGD